MLSKRLLFKKTVVKSGKQNFLPESGSEVVSSISGDSSPSLSLSTYPPYQ
jgi:hypothetical protein